ncbi:hypothetical protein ACPA9J_27735 [Pseudomonas aeruginosa]
MSSRGRLSVKSGRLANQGGAVSSAGTLSLSSQGALNNQGAGWSPTPVPSCAAPASTTARAASSR